MSLLLEALKKAEKAKEEAQRRAREGEGGRGEPPAADAPDAKPVLTRAELPDIRQPLEILSDDIAPKQPQAPSPAPQPAARQAEPRAAEPRAQAKKVFEAKIREPNPRLPFYITLAGLGLFAIGTVVYFWMQLRPPAALVNTNPGRPSGETQTAAAPAKPAAEAPTPTAPAAAAIPGLPGSVVAQPPAAPATTPAAAPAAAAPTPPVAAAPKPEAAKPQPAAPAQPAARPARQVAPAAPPAPPQVHPKVEAAYAAYQAGDLTAARNEYQQALREDPANRDALLGLAATEVRSGRYEVAEAAYLRLLQGDPRDAYAQAGLLALRSARMDPIATESRVKSLLAADPSAHVLHFTLGNQLAQQGRWAEAQQEYFKAFAAEPDNPDFAYNLAVSLDQLRQPKVALEYYRRALALAEKRSASFDAAAARERVSQLGK
jgi:tetratricopeptide (TPR) repeat protein